MEEQSKEQEVLLKESKNPNIQSRVEETRNKLIPQREGSPLEHIHQEARDKVASEIIRARLRRERDKAGMYDHKTKLLNRDAYKSQTEKELEAAKRNPKRKVNVMIMDVDNFGQFNSKYDEMVGDEVLVNVADAMRKESRKSDTVARWGGEEFTGTFPTDPEMEGTTDLTHPAERIRAAIEQIPFNTEQNMSSNPGESQSLPEQITASAGTTSYQPGENFEQLLKRASLALKLAKMLGRNRTIEAVVTPENETLFNDFSSGEQYMCEVDDNNTPIRIHNTQTPEVMDVISGSNGKLQLVNT